MKKISTLFCTALFACSTLLTFAGNHAKVIIPGQDASKIPFVMPKGLVEGSDYIANKLIFQVKSEYRQNCKTNSIDGIVAIQDFLNSIGATDLAKIYPDHKAPDVQKNAIGMELVDISLIYSFKYAPTSVRMEKVINSMKSLGYFEYVEPWYIPKICLVPNDPNYSNSGQYFCKGNVVGSINTQTAWNTTTGSASVVIGVVDTGTEPTHPDLAANYLGGYDVAMNDADPTWQGNNHGCAVSGDADAVTNNGVGVASPGFSCKFKCAKVADATGALIAAYQGIVWAADNGCKIINCSWGGAGGGSYGQTIVDYATINKNCLLVCSAGNGGVEEFLWPSSYNNVYRVAATTNTDAMASFSSYGLDVDYGSPGNIIYSTIDGTSYGSMSGTSMASPVSAGAAALVQSQFNYTNAFQIGERLKQTCDPYAGTSTLNLYNAGKLGKGRIDVGTAVGTGAAKSLSMNPITVTDGNDNAFMPGEILDISGTFINYLDPSSSAASASLSVVSGPGTISSGNPQAIGVLATLGTKVIASGSGFKCTISAAAATNAVIKFKLTITDGSFTASQYFDVTVNVDYINIVINDVHTSITSKGRIGYNLDSQQQGLGFEYQIPSPNNLLYEMSLMIGTSATKVSDMFREASNGNTDFGTVTRVYKTATNTVSDFDVDGKFNDAPSASGAIPVEVHHSAYAWATAPYRKFVIVKYVIKNTGSGSLSNMYAGIVADWDITNSAANKGNFDATNRMGYLYDVSTANGLYAGIKLLTPGTPNNYVIDNVTGGNTGIDVTQTAGFTTALKYTALSTSRNTDGYTATGGDVMDCVSSGPLSVAGGDSVIVAFALIAGDNLADLQNSACQAQAKWDNTGACATIGVNEVTANNFWMEAYPNPASGNINISYMMNGNAASSLTIMNSLGETVMTLNDLSPGRNTLPLDISKLSAGNYFIQMKAGEAITTKKFTVTK